MKFDQTLYIKAEDFPPQYSELINKLGYVLNRFMTQTFQAMNNGIDFSNLNMEVATFTITVDSSGIPTKTTSIGAATIKTAQGMVVINAQDLTTSTAFVPGANFISFTAGQKGTYNINHVTGLTANSQYKITVIIIGQNVS